MLSSVGRAHCLETPVGISPNLGYVFGKNCHILEFTLGPLF